MAGSWKPVTYGGRQVATPSLGGSISAMNSAGRVFGELADKYDAEEALKISNEKDQRLLDISTSDSILNEKDPFKRRLLMQKAVSEANINSSDKMKIGSKRLNLYSDRMLQDGINHINYQNNKTDRDMKLNDIAAEKARLAGVNQFGKNFKNNISFDKTMEGVNQGLQSAYADFRTQNNIADGTELSPEQLKKWDNKLALSRADGGVGYTQNSDDILSGIVDIRNPNRINNIDDVVQRYISNARKAGANTKEIADGITLLKAQYSAPSASKRDNNVFNLKKSQYKDNLISEQKAIDKKWGSVEKALGGNSGNTFKSGGGALLKFQDRMGKSQIDQNKSGINPFEGYINDMESIKIDGVSVGDLISQGKLHPNDAAAVFNKLPSGWFSDTKDISGKHEDEIVKGIRTMLKTPHTRYEKSKLSTTQLSQMENEYANVLGAYNKNVNALGIAYQNQGGQSTARLNDAQVAQQNLRNIFGAKDKPAVKNQVKKEKTPNGNNIDKSYVVRNKETGVSNNGSNANDVLGNKMVQEPMKNRIKKPKTIEEMNNLFDKSVIQVQNGEISKEKFNEIMKMSENFKPQEVTKREEINNKIKSLEKEMSLEKDYINKDYLKEIIRSEKNQLKKEVQKENIEKRIKGFDKKSSDLIKKQNEYSIEIDSLNKRLSVEDEPIKQRLIRRRIEKIKDRIYEAKKQNKRIAIAKNNPLNRK